MLPRLWRSAFKIAWRESRSSTGKFLFVILAVAVGVGALSGVRGFSASFREMLLQDARTLMRSVMPAIPSRAIPTTIWRSAR